MENKRRVLYRKELEWLALAKKYLAKNDFWGYQNNARDAAHDLFFDNDNLRIEFLETVPVRELAVTRDTLDLLATMSGSDNIDYCGYRQSMKRENVIKNVEMIEEAMKKYLSSHTCYTIFYSWQSDTESKYNRSFIEEAVAKSIKQVNERTNTSFSLDENANGVPGSPDIFNVIKTKIDCAFGFIADVTSIGTISDKSVPNPNVMCELGYAFSSLGDERIILLCNTALTDIHTLPFDIETKRAILYDLSTKNSVEEKSKIKENIIGRLTTALMQIQDL